MMTSLNQQVAVVTGASSGIGRAIALALAAQGVQLCLVGRKQADLQAVAELACQTSGEVLLYCADLTDDSAIAQLQEKLVATFGQVDLLIHAAGLVLLEAFETAAIEDFDRQYRINVRVPYLLTQTLLPLLTPQQAQIVFINSSVIQRPKPGAAQYAATKHALKAIADAIRVEVNPRQIRVLSVYPGRTATPLQALLYQQKQKAYEPSQLVQPEDIAETIISALTLPRTAEITDIYVRPLLSSE